MKVQKIVQWAEQLQSMIVVLADFISLFKVIYQVITILCGRSAKLNDNIY